MRNSRKKITILFAALFFVVFSFAGNRLSPEQKAQKQVERMDNVCSLTVQQKDQIKQLYLNYNKVLAENGNNKQNVGNGSNPYAKRKEFINSINKVLSAEQKTK